MAGNSYTISQVAGVPAALLALSWATALTRCWVKKKILNSFGIDDYLIVVSMIFFTALCLLVFHASAHGFGKHVNQVSTTDLAISLRDWIIFEMMHVITTAVLKLSITIFLLRLTSTMSPQRWVLYSTAGLYTVVSIILLFVLGFQCYPLAYFWDHSIEGGYCRPLSYVGNAAYVNTSISAATDFVLALTPIWLVWDLKLDIRTKLSVALLLGMGNLSAAVNFVRLVHIPDLLKSQDILFDLYPFMLWSTVEAGVGISAASMAAFKPLLRSCMHALGIYTQPSRSGQYDSEALRNSRHSRKYNKMTKPLPLSSGSTSRDVPVHGSSGGDSTFILGADSYELKKT